MQPKQEPPRFDWARLVYDIDSDATVLVSNEPDPNVARVRVWTYDLLADTWTEEGAAPTDAVVSLAYDPVSGLVVAAGVLDRRNSMWTYDLEAGSWTPIEQANAGPSDGAVFVWGSVLAYDASVDRLVVYTYNGYTGQLETWLFDVRTGTWSRSSAQTPGVVWGLGLPNIVYAEAAKRTVITSWGAAAYDASANRWDRLVSDSMEEGFMPTASMVYDPVNERLVGPGPYHNATGVHVGRAPVLAFDPGTREWTVLLEPGEPQPAPVTPPPPTSAPMATPSGGTETTGLTSPMPTTTRTSTP
jgi:hypothetical protein